MLNITQEQWVINRLKEKGEISRNECLRNYISRLGAIIANLKDKGWKFDAEYRKVKTPFGWNGNDYVYKVSEMAKG